MRRQVAACGRAGVEVVVVVAVEQALVGRGAGVGHGDARVVLVAHPVPAVGAVPVHRAVRGRPLDAPEVVHQLVGLYGVGQPPAPAVDPGVAGAGVVEVCLSRLVVAPDGADAAVDPGIGPDQVLPVDPVQADRLQLGLGVVDRVIAGGAQLHPLDHEVARRVGRPPHPAHAAGLSRAVDEHLVHPGRGVPDHRRHRVEPVGDVGSMGVDGLHPVAVDAVADARQGIITTGLLRCICYIYRIWSMGTSKAIMV